VERPDARPDEPHLLLNRPDDEKALHQSHEDAPDAGESPVVVQRATDEFVHRLRGVEHLRRDFAAANGQRSIE
jgi:hypothetical protein